MHTKHKTRCQRAYEVYGDRIREMLKNRGSVEFYADSLYGRAAAYMRYELDELKQIAYNPENDKVTYIRIPDAERFCLACGSRNIKMHGDYYFACNECNEKIGWN